MPAYNVEKYIHNSINSVLSQSYKKWELLIVDDNSTDKTRDIIKSFAKTDKRIKPIFRKTNGGKPSIAKNSALEHIKGEYIAFLDSDDIWLKEKLEKQVELMKNKKYKLCYTGGYFIDEKDNKIGEFLPKYGCGYIFKNMLFRYELNNQSVLITRDVFKKFNEYITIGEDYNLFMDIIYNYKICNIKEKLIKYRIHKTSITKSKKKILHQGVAYTMKEMNRKYAIFKQYPFLYILNLIRAYRFKIYSYFG